ncbi:hypothetical protein LJC22_01580 [Desulfosarcina sp. OttesenSCG-928-G10]|nr:hypothetical protein [Desulfosarcina sp. OttesenSCG-928-G10]MDL2320898.1 hypothetical protein [Desulfosarcina sp. OttesenSCG-928-B08]
MHPVSDDAATTAGLHSGEPDAGADTHGIRVPSGDDPETQLHLSNVSFDPTIASRIKGMAMSDSDSTTRLLPEQASLFLMGIALVSMSVIFRKQWEKKNSRPSSSP